MTKNKILRAEYPTLNLGIIIRGLIGLSPGASIWGRGCIDIYVVWKKVLEHRAGLAGLQVEEEFLEPLLAVHLHNCLQTEKRKLASILHWLALNVSIRFMIGGTSSRCAFIIIIITCFNQGVNSLHPSILLCCSKIVWKIFNLLKVF